MIIIGTIERPKMKNSEKIVAMTKGAYLKGNISPVRDKVIIKTNEVMAMTTNIFILLYMGFLDSFNIEVKLVLPLNFVSETSRYNTDEIYDALVGRTNNRRK